MINNKQHKFYQVPGSVIPASQHEELKNNTIKNLSQCHITHTQF